MGQRPKRPPEPEERDGAAIEHEPGTCWACDEARFQAEAPLVAAMRRRFEPRRARTVISMSLRAVLDRIPFTRAWEL